MHKLVSTRSITWAKRDFSVMFHHESMIGMCYQHSAHHRIGTHRCIGSPLHPSQLDRLPTPAVPFGARARRLFPYNRSRLIGLNSCWLHLGTQQRLFR